MENKTVGIIISFAVAILIGVILIAIISGEINSKTTLVSYTETIDISATRLVGGAINASVLIPARTALDFPSSTSWRTGYDDCAIKTISLYNQTGGILSSSADYTWTADGNGVAGSLSIKNTPATNTSALNTTTVIYRSCPNEYVVDGWQKTVLNLVPGFFALAILLGGVFVIFYVLRQEGVDLSTK